MLIHAAKIDKILVFCAKNKNFVPSKRFFLLLIGCGIERIPQIGIIKLGEIDFLALRASLELFLTCKDAQSKGSVPPP